MIPENIIVRTPNFIGDTIMMLPALELIRKEYPKALVTIVCKPACVDIFREKNIHQIITDDTKGIGRAWKTFHLLKKIRKKNYDLGFLFHNSFLTALLFRLSNTKKLIGYNKEGRKFLLNYSLPIDRNWHYVNHYAYLVNSYFGCKYKELPPMRLESQTGKILHKMNKPIVGFVLGKDCSSQSSAKADYIYGIKKGVRNYPFRIGKNLFKSINSDDFYVVFLGDTCDSKINAMYEELLKKNKVDTLNLTGKTSVGEYIDVINSLDLLVTIDTSAMHIAAATNTEFIVLVGKGTSPLSCVYPKDAKGHIINRGQSCINASDMMCAITPDDIYNKIIEVLKKKVNFGNYYS